MFSKSVGCDAGRLGAPPVENLAVKHLVLELSADNGTDVTPKDPATSDNHELKISLLMLA